MRRHKCRKSGQYGYLYSASLSSRGITSWVFSMSNKTHESQHSCCPFSKNDLSVPHAPCQGWDFEEEWPTALKGRAWIGHTNGGGTGVITHQITYKTLLPFTSASRPNKTEIEPTTRRKTNHKFDTLPLRGAVWTFHLLLAVKIHPTRNHLYASTSSRAS